LNIRIIPRLDIKGPNLVKGIHLEGLRVLGKPESFARYYYEGGADELIYMDVVASLYGRNSLHDIVERTSSEIFIPLCVGGGLRTVEDIRMVLRAGADKVSLNTAAIDRPELITEAARRFGSSTILVSIEAIRMPGGNYEAFTDNGRESTGVDALEWAVRAVELGAGELMVTSIDKEGTGQGFDLELVRRISDSVDVPVIASGGAGGPEDVFAAVDEGRAQAVALASILHYGALDHGGSGGDFTAEGNTTFLSSGRSLGRMRPATIADVKEHLIEHGIECRPAQEATNV
jgi:cyclase